MNDKLNQLFFCSQKGRGGPGMGPRGPGMGPRMRGMGPGPRPLMSQPVMRPGMRPPGFMGPGGNMMGPPGMMMGPGPMGGMGPPNMMQMGQSNQPEVFQVELTAVSSIFLNS